MNWFRRIPGFGTTKRWAAFIVGIIYLMVGLWTLFCVAIGYWQLGIWSMLVAVILVALLTNADSIRTRAPLLRSSSRWKAALGWMMCIVVGAATGLGSMLWSSGNESVRAQVEARRITGLTATMEASYFTATLTSKPSDTAAPNATATLTKTVRATDTSKPTDTARPTNTIRATNTTTPTNTPRPTATPTPISRVWKAPNRDVEIGFGMGDAIKVKVLEVNRTNNLGIATGEVDVARNSELVIVRLEYRSTQGRKGHSVTAASDFVLRASGGEIRPLPDTQVRLGELLNGQVPNGQALTGNIVFLVDASDVISSLVYTATRERKQIDIAGGGTTIRQPQPTFTPFPTATPDAAMTAGRATMASQHLEAAQEYRSASQLGLALVELDQTLAISPGLESARQLQSQVQAEVSAAVLIAEAEAHLSNAREYRAAGQLGLALVELDQAGGIAPGYEPAQELRAQVRTEATAVVQQVQAQATAAAAVARRTRLLDARDLINKSPQYVRNRLGAPRLTSPNRYDRTGEDWTYGREFHEEPGFSRVCCTSDEIELIFLSGRLVDIKVRFYHPTTFPGSDEDAFARLNLSSLQAPNANFSNCGRVWYNSNGIYVMTEKSSCASGPHTVSIRPANCVLRSARGGCA
jgi:hypothetical protein